MVHLEFTGIIEYFDHTLRSGELTALIREYIDLSKGEEHAVTVNSLLNLPLKSPQAIYIGNHPKLLADGNS
jgi:hypothetical protein